MNKNIIKKYLSETFLSEETKPKGLANTEKVQKQSGATNKAAMKDVEKEVKDYDNSTKTEKENADAVKKYENSSEQDDLHDLGELQNGSLAATKVNSPSDVWQERQDKAISGKDSTLGNSRDYANVIPADQAGFTGPEFGENLVKDIKKAKELRDKAEDKYNRLSTAVSGADFNDKKMNEGMLRGEDGKPRSRFLKGQNVELSDGSVKTIAKVSLLSPPKGEQSIIYRFTDEPDGGFELEDNIVKVIHEKLEERDDLGKWNEPSDDKKAEIGK